MPVTLTYSRVGPSINETPINVSLQQLAAKFNAGITAADISPTANIPGTVIAAGTLPNTAIVAASITNAQMATGASGILSANIVPGTIVGSNIAPATVLWTNLKVSSFDWILSSTVVGSHVQANTSYILSTALNYASAIPLGVMLENVTQVVGITPPDVGTGAFQTLPFLTYGCVHNKVSGDDKLYISVANTTAVGIDVTNVVLRLFYISTS